jgi:hypothetical protein
MRGAAVYSPKDRCRFRFPCSDTIHHSELPSIRHTERTIMEGNPHEQKSDQIFMTSAPALVSDRAQNILTDRGLSAWRIAIAL